MFRGIEDTYKTSIKTESVKAEIEMLNDCLRLYGSKEFNHRAFSVCDDEVNSDTEDEVLQSVLNKLQSVIYEPRENLALFKNKEIIECLCAAGQLKIEKHVNLLMSELTAILKSKRTSKMDYPWLFFWILHSLNLFDKKHMLSQDVINEISMRLESCQSINGGFGRNNTQSPHIISTYAAIAAAYELCDGNLLKKIDREKIFTFLLSLKDLETGGFKVSSTSVEIDPRSAYCAVVIAQLLQFTEDQKNHLFDGLEVYINSLQSYDGGISAANDLESHAAYTYCGFAALALLKKHDYLNLEKLLWYTVNRYSADTGGFTGRPNKLTDSCYTFWCSAVLAIFRNIGYTDIIDSNVPFVHAIPIQLYLLCCCQDSLAESILTYEGGLRDKPSKPIDVYHTCYALSGLALYHNGEPTDTQVGAYTINSTNIYTNITKAAEEVSKAFLK